MKILLLSLFAGLSSLLTFSQSAPADVKLLGDEPHIMIDPEQKQGKTVIYLQNTSGKDRTVMLSSKNIFSKVSGHIIPGLVEFRLPGSSGGSPVFTSTIKKNSNLAVEVEVNLYVQAGEAFFHIFNGTDTLERVHILQGNMPFNISLVSDNPNEPAIILRRGDKNSMVLMNDDPVHYIIDWSLYIPGTEFYLKDSMVYCPAKKTVEIPLHPDGSLFTNKFEGYFRDMEKTAQLTLSYRGAGGLEYSYPSKTIQVKTWFKYYSERKKTIWGNVIIFAVLALGGIASAFLNIWMPNKNKKNVILRQLNRIALRTHEISYQIYSGLRVEVRVNRMQIREEAGALRPFYPESSQAYDNLQKRAVVLERRVELVRKLDNVTQSFEAMKGEAMAAPAKRMDMIKNWLDEVTEKLMLSMPEESDLKIAEENIGKAGGLLENMIHEDPKFAEQLSTGVSSLAEAFEGLKVSDALAPYKDMVKNLLSLVTDPELAARYSDPKNIQPRHYHWLSSSLERLAVLRQVINLWEGHPDRRMRLEEREAAFINNLNSRTWHTLAEVRQFRNEMAENIFPEDLIRAIQNNEFRIDASPTMHPKPNEKVCLEVVFSESRFNDCSARESIRCEWDFGRVGMERGWEIIHYFRNEAEAKFKVRFFRKNGEMIQINGQEEITVESIKVLEKERQKREGGLWLEFVKFSIAFIIAIIALFVGAKEQVMKLDLVGGMIAVFLLGYGADTIKNLATKRRANEESS